MDRRIRKIVIVGGGTAGWIAASMLARTALEHQCSITVIESSDIPAIGVGEATIPPIVDLLRMLGIDEADFIRHTDATFKLGIEFEGWRTPGERYWHPFGTFGANINRRPFHHFFLKARRAGQGPSVADYSPCAALSEAGRFRFPDPRMPPTTGIRYALHFDAGRVANYLREYARRLGVERLDRKVVGANLGPRGLIETLACEDGSTIAGDLYLDCSGFRGLLIEEALGTGYLDWRYLLPCDRAVALQTRGDGAPAPFTRATARAAGWHWRIPLQHRTGNGYVYSSAHLSDTAATDDLVAAFGAEPPLNEPRTLRFTTGRRKLFWNRNCIALGLASGFLEPLESTSIQLVINAVLNLLDHFPDRDFDERNIASYNAELIEEFEGVRDFIVLHYCRTQRDDTEFWKSCRALEPPDSLRARIELYEATGRIRAKPRELFTDLSWFYVLDGMGVTPRAIDPLVEGTLFDRVQEPLASIRAGIEQTVREAPSHASWFAPGSRTNYCAARS